MGAARASATRFKQNQLDVRRLETLGAGSMIENWVCLVVCVVVPRLDLKLFEDETEDDLVFGEYSNPCPKRCGSFVVSMTEQPPHTFKRAKI